MGGTARHRILAVYSFIGADEGELEGIGADNTGENPILVYLFERASVKVC